MKEEIIKFFKTTTKPIREYCDLIYNWENYNKFGMLTIRPIIMFGGTVLFPFAVLTNLLMIFCMIIIGLFGFNVIYLVIGIYNLLCWFSKVGDKLDVKIEKISKLLIEQYNKIFKNV
jgi:hypothetical protein